MPQLGTEAEKVILVPEKTNEIKYIQYSTLEATANRINNYLVKLTTEQEKEAKRTKKNVEDVAWKFSKLKYIKMIRDCIKDYFGLDMGLVQRIKAGDVETHIDKYREWDLDVVQNINLLGLYEYLFTILFKYKAKQYNRDFTFQIGEDLFVIKGFIVDAVIKKTKNPKLTVQEVCECMIVEENYEKYVFKIDDEEDKELGGTKLKGYQYKAQLNFVKNLKKIAILSRKVGEDLPLDELEFRDWLDKRYAKMLDIGMENALDCLFFFRQYHERLENSSEYEYYFNNVPLERRANEKIQDYAKRISKNEELNKKIFRRVGHKSLYGRLIRAGYFNKSDERPIHSVKMAAYEEALKLISVDNALKIV